jgi:hypothetical protein
MCSLNGDDDGTSSSLGKVTRLGGAVIDTELKLIKLLNHLIEMRKKSKITMC